MDLNVLSHQVIGAAIAVHREVGPGLLESAYESALNYELNERGFKVERQKNMPFAYKGMAMDVGYRLDIVVEDALIIEIKSVEALLPLHFAQTLTYLKLSGLKLGLLINSNSPLLRDGIHRIVNNL